MRSHVTSCEKPFKDLVEIRETKEGGGWETQNCHYIKKKKWRWRRRGRANKQTRSKKKIGTKYNKRKSICCEEIKGKNKFIYTKVHTKTILLMQKKKEVLTRPWRILHLNNSKGIQENLLFSKSLEKISYS